jgi:hypothetical protein
VLRLQCAGRNVGCIKNVTQDSCGVVVLCLYLCNVIVTCTGTKERVLLLRGLINSTGLAVRRIELMLKVSTLECRDVRGVFYLWMVNLTMLPVAQNI